MRRQRGNVNVSRAAMQILWPSFLGAAMAVGVFFSAFDPQSLSLIGLQVADSREGAYTVGFFFFWIIFSLTGALTWFLASTDTEAGRDRRDTSGTRA